MADRMHRECDVWPDRNGTRYRVMISRVGEDGQPDGPPLQNIIADLCEPAYERLMRFIERGLNPPTKREKT